MTSRIIEPAVTGRLLRPRSSTPDLPSISEARKERLRVSIRRKRQVRRPAKNQVGRIDAKKTAVRNIETSNSRGYVIFKAQVNRNNLQHKVSNYKCKDLTITGFSEIVPQPNVITVGNQRSLGDSCNPDKASVRDETM